MRYKQSYLNGENISLHRKLWIEAYGEIPKGMVIHHIDEDKMNNNLDNLAMLSAAGHMRIHSLGRASWNKGMKYGETEAYKKANRNRRRNHDKVCIQTLAYYEEVACTQEAVAKKFAISRRQVCDRLKRGRELRDGNNV